MLVPAAMPLATLAIEMPRASRVLLRHGLDFCCGGGQTLEEACKRKGLPLESIRSELEALASRPEDVRWDAVPNSRLIQHILDTYHAPLEEDLIQLIAMSDKVLRVHGAKDTKRLEALAASVCALSDELLPHARKEELVLFPWILQQRQPRPQAPISVMRREHEVAGGLLERIKELTTSSTPPAEACNTWRNLYARLAEFDASLREHIHLENNILFPRALEF